MNALLIIAAVALTLVAIVLLWPSRKPSPMDPCDLIAAHRSIPASLPTGETVTIYVSEARIAEFMRTNKAVVVNSAPATKAVGGYYVTVRANRLYVA